MRFTDLKFSSGNSCRTVIKLILIGPTNSGKTSLGIRYAEGVYRKEESTPGVSILGKKFELDGTCYDVQIWDTGGQER